MEKKNTKRYILSGYYIDADYDGKFICDTCQIEIPWTIENFEEMRCMNKSGRCNGVMRLRLSQKERSEN
jgi:hypothetical protein